VADNIWCSKVKPREWKGLKPEKPVGGIYAVEANCSQEGCTASFRLVLHRMEPPRSCIKKIERHGWAIGNKIKCPEHAGRTKAQKEEEMGAPGHRPGGTGQGVVTAAGAAMAGTSAIAASAAASAGKRLVYQYLEIYYKAQPCPGYTDGYSDAKVAQECGVSAELVRKIREEDFGPLSAPPELVALQDEAAGIVKKAEELETAAHNLRAEGRALLTKIDSLCVKNGWKQ
jgi:hypothetical protein